MSISNLKNCFGHKEIKAENICKICRIPLCSSCSIEIDDKIYCQKCTNTHLRRINDENSRHNGKYRQYC